MLSRREFLQHGAVGLAAFFVPDGFSRIAAASTTAPTLVLLSLRGAADGLNLVIPAGDPLYYSNRPIIQVPPGSELPLDGFFGLNPALAPIEPYFQSGELCIVHAFGSPDPTRSHFDAQSFMDFGAPGDKSVRDGWLNRVLLTTGSSEAIAAIGLGTRATPLAGLAPSLTLIGLNGFGLTGQYRPQRRQALEDHYALHPGTLLGASAADAFEALDRISGVDRTTTVTYPDTVFGTALRDAAALVKADIGVQFLTLDLGGWDHHNNEAYQMSVVGPDLAAGLAAFYQDLGACAATTLTLCVSEFGRRVADNGSGTDHGRGGVAFLLGGGVGGGRVLTRSGWPGLAPEQLDRGQDLAVTTDFRDVFAEILYRHIGLSLAELTPVFPDFAVDEANFIGLYA